MTVLRSRPVNSGGSGEYKAYRLSIRLRMCPECNNCSSQSLQIITDFLGQNDNATPISITT